MTAPPARNSSASPPRPRIVRADTARRVRVGKCEDWVEVGDDGVVVEHDALGWRRALYWISHLTGSAATSAKY
jgi:hypothetical protein